MMALGVILPLHERFTYPNNEATGVPGLVLPGLITHAWDAGEDDIDAGHDTDFHMQQTSWELKDGLRQYSMIDDFYFRIYINVETLAFGTFSADKTISIRIWNAYFGDTTLETVTPDFGDEVVFDQASGLPTNFRGLEYKFFSFTAEGDGGTVLSDLFTLTFDTDNFADDTFFLPVTGFRVPALTDLVWEFKPQWSQPYEIEYEFKTNIITSANGAEQRIRDRQTPRKTITQPVALRGVSRSELNRVVVANQGGVFYVPERTRYATTAADMPAEAIVSVLEEEPPWWLKEEDNYVILEHRDQISLRKVGPYTGTESNSDEFSVNYKSDDEFAWPAGTKIYPALRMWMADEISGTYLTNAVATYTAKFLAVPGFEAAEPASSPSVFFDQREVFLRKPNWAEGAQAINAQPTVFIDFGVGRVNRLQDVEHHTQRVTLSYVGRNQEDADELRKFFFRCAGRCHEFFMPTWCDDIPLAHGFDEFDTRIGIDGLDFAVAWVQDAVRSSAGVAIVLNNGTVLYRRISDITGESGFSYIEFFEPMGVTADLDEIAYVCWMPLWRMSTDTLTIRWETSDVATMALTMETLPYNGPDDDSNSDSASGSGSTS